jgi:hypothetical protein
MMTMNTCTTENPFLPLRPPLRFIGREVVGNTDSPPPLVRDRKSILANVELTFDDFVEVLQDSMSFEF